MFDSVDMAELIEHQTKFIAVAMGGPGKYDDNLLRSHFKTIQLGVFLLNR